MHRHGLPIEQIERDLREEARNRAQLSQHVEQRGVEAPRKRRFQELALRPARWRNIYYILKYETGQLGQYEGNHDKCHFKQARAQNQKGR